MAYVRITAYSPKEDFCAILEACDKYDQLWEFSAFLVAKGLNIIAVCPSERIVPDTLVYLPLIENPSKKIILRALEKGKPITDEIEYEGRKCMTVTVGKTVYAQYMDF